MSMYPQEIGPIPAETMRVARAAYPKGSLAMRLRDELGGMYQDEQFSALFPVGGQPAETAWRLAIVLVLQYVEGLTDRQAAEAVRGRIDWKYALGLELSDPGFDASVLAEFRERLVAGQAETLLLDVLLERCMRIVDVFRRTRKIGFAAPYAQYQACKSPIRKIRFATMSKPEAKSHRNMTDSTNTSELEMSPGYGCVRHWRMASIWQWFRLRCSTSSIWKIRSASVNRNVSLAEAADPIFHSQ